MHPMTLLVLMLVAMLPGVAAEDDWSTDDPPKDATVAFNETPAPEATYPAWTDIDLLNASVVVDNDGFTVTWGVAALMERPSLSSYISSVNYYAQFDFGPMHGELDVVVWCCDPSWRAIIGRPEGGPYVAVLIPLISEADNTVSVHVPASLGGSERVTDFSLLRVSAFFKAGESVTDEVEGDEGVKLSIPAPPAEPNGSTGAAADPSDVSANETGTLGAVGLVGTMLMAVSVSRHRGGRRQS